MTAADWPAVARIYAAGIAGGDATFEHIVPSWADWSQARLPALRLVAREQSSSESGVVSSGKSVTELGDRFVTESGDGSDRAPGAGSGEVCGWAALSPVSARAVYCGVGAVSIYVDPSHARRGVGRALLSTLVEESERAGLWTLEAGIFPENRASVALHEGCGFRLVGVRHRIGQMCDGRWRDVALYERRSSAIGV
jgi:L-amino acid N-acyltransferase YncA